MAHSGGENQRAIALLRARQRSLYGRLGRAGKQWSGTAIIKICTLPGHRRPRLSMTSLTCRMSFPARAGETPWAQRALTLSQGEHAIRGTNNPGSIGGFVSYGRIRMYNADILDLYGRVGFGTPVVVTR